MTTESYHDTRLKALLDTWGSEVDSIKVFTDAFFEYKNCVSKICDVIKYDNYNIPKYQKHTICKLKEILLENVGVNFDFMFISDDDTYVDINKFKTLLKDFDPSEKIVIGKIIDCHPIIKNINYFSGGAGIIITKSALLDICEFIDMFDKKELIESFIWSDVLLGYVINNTGINKINTDLFNTGIENKCNEFITLHYVDCKSFYEIYENN